MNKFKYSLGCVCFAFWSPAYAWLLLASFFDQHEQYINANKQYTVYVNINRNIYIFTSMNSILLCEQ